MSTKKKIETKSERKTARFSENEMKILESKIRNTGLSFSELIVKNIIEDENQNEVLDTIVWESEQVQEKIEAFQKAYQADMQSYGSMISKLQKNIYKTFAELNMDIAMKKNIFMYKQGDLIKTSKNHLLIVLSVNEETHELKATLAPLLANPEINILNVKESGENFVSVFRQ